MGMGGGERTSAISAGAVSGTAEALNLFPHANLRLRQNNSTLAAYDWTVLHRDAQGTVRAVTDSSGARAERFVYRPYGTQISTYTGVLTGKQSKGWIGERFDAEAGLQYLNARYYDPELGMFLQPDWWEVTEPGVGTNRYSYAFGDPVNGIDPGGHWANESAGDACCANDYSFWLPATSSASMPQGNEGIQDTFNFGTNTNYIFDPTYYNMSSSMDVVNQVSASYTTGGRVGAAASSLISGGSANFGFENMAFNAGPISDHWSIGHYSGDVVGQIHKSDDGSLSAFGTVAIDSDFYSWKPNRLTFEEDTGLALLGMGLNSPGQNNMYVTPLAHLLLGLQYGAEMAPMPPFDLINGVWVGIGGAVNWSTPSSSIAALSRQELQIDYNRKLFFYVGLGK